MATTMQSSLFHGFLKFDSYSVLSFRLAYCIPKEVNIPGHTDSREWGNILVQCKLGSFEDLFLGFPSLTLVPESLSSTLSAILALWRPLLMGAGAFESTLPQMQTIRCSYSSSDMRSHLGFLLYIRA